MVYEDSLRLIHSLKHSPRDVTSGASKHARLDYQHRTETGSASAFPYAPPPPANSSPARYVSPPVEEQASFDNASAAVPSIHRSTIQGMKNAAPMPPLRAAPPPGSVATSSGQGSSNEHYANQTASVISIDRLSDPPTATSSNHVQGGQAQAKGAAAGSVYRANSTQASIGHRQMVTTRATGAPPENLGARASAMLAADAPAALEGSAPGVARRIAISPETAHLQGTSCVRGLKQSVALGVSDADAPVADTDALVADADAPAADAPAADAPAANGCTAAVVPAIGSPSEWDEFLGQLNKDVKAASVEEFEGRSPHAAAQAEQIYQMLEPSEDGKDALAKRPSPHQLVSPLPQMRERLGQDKPTRDEMDEALIRMIKAEMTGGQSHKDDQQLVLGIQAEQGTRTPPPIPPEMFMQLPDTPRELKGGPGMEVLAGVLQSSLKGEQRFMSKSPARVSEQSPSPEKSSPRVCSAPYMAHAYECDTGQQKMQDTMHASLVYTMDKDELEEVFLAAIDEAAGSSDLDHPSQSAMCRAVQAVGTKLKLDTVAMKKLFLVVKSHSEVATMSSPLQQSRRFLEHSAGHSRLGPRVLKRSIIDSREALIEDFAEALHTEDELARLGGNPPPAPSRAQRKRAKALFKIIDANSDGSLSIEEISSAFSEDWLRRGLHTILISEAQEAGGQVGLPQWTKFTKRLIKEQGPGFVNFFLTEMLSKQLPALCAEEQREGLIAFGAMDADLSGTLDVDEIHIVFDECYPEYLVNRPQSLVRVEKGCIDATMWLMFLREIKNFEGPNALKQLLDHINGYQFQYDAKKNDLYKQFTGPLFASAMLVCMDYANAIRT